MPKKKFSAEQIVTKLRQVEVLLAQGKTIAIACKEVGTTDKNSGMNVSMAKSSTASRKHKWSLRNGAFTTTPNVRIHRWVTGRLRHSPSRQNPSPLPIIGALLGHAHSATTQRYAPLSDDPLRAASDAVGRQITAALNPTTNQDNVTKLFGDNEQ